MSQSFLISRLFVVILQTLLRLSGRTTKKRRWHAPDLKQDSKDFEVLAREKDFKTEVRHTQDFLQNINMTFQEVRLCRSMIPRLLMPFQIV